MPDAQPRTTIECAKVGVFILGWKDGFWMGAAAGFMAALLLAGFVL